MKILRIRNHNSTDAKVKWSSASHDTVTHLLKGEYRTTLFLLTDALESVSVPYGTEVMLTEDGNNWALLQERAPKGELPDKEA
jgi:hypothetical protein